MFLYFYVSMCLRVYVSICLCLCLYVSMFLCLYVSMCLYVYVSVCLSIYLSIYLSTYLSIFLCLLIYPCMYQISSTLLIYYMCLNISLCLPHAGNIWFFKQLTPQRGLHMKKAMQIPGPLVRGAELFHHFVQVFSAAGRSYVGLSDSQRRLSTK